MKTTIVTVDDVVNIINKNNGVLLLGRERIVPEKLEYSIGDRYWVVISEDGEHIKLTSLRMER